MDNTFIVYDTSPAEAPDLARIFRDPKEIIICQDVNDVTSCFNRLEDELSRGNYAAGFLSYELGLHFQEIPFIKKSIFPLLCFGIFPSYEKIKIAELGAEQHSFNTTNGSYSVPEKDYNNDLRLIKEHIKDGNTYQVNYTFKYKFDFKGSPYSLFRTLGKKQEVPYAAFLDLEKFSILSLSPELFFYKNGDEMFVKPMKGTINRGKIAEEDDLNKNNLFNSDKNRAENIMIVDLLRNDLGKVSETGSVRVDKLFDVEKYSTIFQMTSTIRSHLKTGTPWEYIFKSIFPSGSVTGAPKKRTMQIIQEIEKEERDIYTGSIGYIEPNGNALFNVAIRTLLIDKEKGKGEMGLGSGIVYDSEADKEYSESKLKGSFLTCPDFSPEFDLIETILWENGSYFLLDLHLERMEASVRYFSYSFDKKKILRSLEKLSTSFAPQLQYKVRLLLNKCGELSTASDIIEKAPDQPLKIAVSKKRTNIDNIFFYHKTTNRSLYDLEFNYYKEKGFFDVIFLNQKNEITEGAITNIVIQKNGEYLTPPVSCGLLDGTYRKYLLRSKTLPAKEKVLYLEDLKNADNIFLTNSVRKMFPAVLQI